MSHHVVFLKNISFFSIPCATHDLIRSDLIRIDPFFKDSNSCSNTSNSPSHLLLPFPLHYPQRVHASSSACIDTLLSWTPNAC